MIRPLIPIISQLLCFAFLHFFHSTVFIHMADWANLPTDLLDVIAQRLGSMEDSIVFGAVCKSWFSVTFILKEKTPLPPKFPWLMLAEANDKKGESFNGEEVVQPRCFFSLSTGKIYELEMPEASCTRCLAAHYGWLLTLGNDLQINLLHPFSRHQICLPPFLSFSDHYRYDEKFKPQRVIDIFIKKVALSSNPWKEKTMQQDYEQEDCVIMAIYGEFRILAFARPGDTLWTNVRIPSRCYDDIVFYKGRFYAVDCHGIVVVCDIDADGGPSASVIAPAPPGNIDFMQKYIVESSGDLLLVSRILRGFLFERDALKNNVNRAYYTIGYSVLKMEKCCQERSEYPFSWAKVKSLGDRALFLGNNSSVSLSASEYNGCFRANCIYFTDDNSEHYWEEQGRGGGSDMGMFDMENGTIEPHYRGISLGHLSPPVWII